MTDIKKRVVTGYRPTGKMHLGHLEGNLKNMLKLQEEFESFFFIVDWHALTTSYTHPEDLQQNTEDMVIDWLAAGIDPSRCSIYLQSDIPEIAELYLYFSILTPVSWLERVPHYKDQIQALGSDIATHGFLGYGVLMTADILILHGETVPVGEDQLPHLELAREIARRFNHYYGEYFKEPQATLSHVARVAGLDGRKMSKSYGNSIGLSDEPEVIWEKIRVGVTDPARVKRTDVGDPEKCPMYSLHKIYTNEEGLKWVVEGCTTAGIGCIECKKLLSDNVAETLAGFREKRRELATDPGLVKKVLKEGADRARPIAVQTIHDIRRLMKIG